MDGKSRLLICEGIGLIFLSSLLLVVVSFGRDEPKTTGGTAVGKPEESGPVKGGKVVADDPPPVTFGAPPSSPEGQAAASGWVDITHRTTGVVTVQTRPYQWVRVRLPSNPATGYRWDVCESHVLSKYGLSTFIDPKAGDDVAGQPGQQQFTFWPYRVGSGELIFRRSRHFDDTVVETVRFKIEVRDAGAAGVAPGGPQ